MARIGGGLFGLVGSIMQKQEEDAREQRQRENMLAATMSRSRGYQEPDGSDYPDPSMQAPPTISLPEAVNQSLQHALELASRIESPEEGALRPDDQLRKDYLSFFGYLHNPDHADPVQQVGMVCSLLRMNLTTQMYFQLRNENSLAPEFPNTVPQSLKYYVDDEQGGGAGPISSGFSMSRFLVNTFRDLGQAYIAYGGVSEPEMRRLTDYIKMLNNYLKEHNLLRTMDPYRKGEYGTPYFGLMMYPEDAAELSQSQGIDMPGAGGINMSGNGGIDMPGSKGIDMPGSGGIDMPGAGGINMPGSGGIDMPGSSGIDMPGSGENESQPSMDLEARGDFSLGGGDGLGLGERGDFSLGGGDGLGLGERGDFSLGGGDGLGLGERGDFSLGAGGLGDRDESGLGNRDGFGSGERDAFGFSEGEGLGLGDRDDFYLK